MCSLFQRDSVYRGKLEGAREKNGNEKGLGREKLKAVGSDQQTERLGDRQTNWGSDRVSVEIFPMGSNPDIGRFSLYGGSAIRYCTRSASLRIMVPYSLVHLDLRSERHTHQHFND